MVRKQGDEITGINRRGLVVAIPDAIREAVEHIPYDVLIDGEAVGDTLHAFDLLEVKGNDLRQRRYLDRFAGLIMVIPPNLPALRWVSTAIDPNDKLETFEELKESGGEGVVFKDVDAPFSPGRPNSGGPQLKFKFVESASFVVTGHNAKRSVTLGLYNADGDKLVPAGNVTIPPNHPFPKWGLWSDVRYLYALKQSGSIYQPVYLGPRNDIPAADCTVDQLKYKPEPQPPPQQPPERNVPPPINPSRQGPTRQARSHDTPHSATGETPAAMEHPPQAPWRPSLSKPPNHQPTNHPMKITDAFITPMPRPMPEGMFDPMPEVIATFEDGSSKPCSRSIPDEVSFRASEFVGLTEEEAHSLFQQKDTSYLRS